MFGLQILTKLLQTHVTGYCYFYCYSYHLHNHHDHHHGDVLKFKMYFPILELSIERNSRTVMKIQC